MERKVAVVGLGAVTPIGNDVESYWKGLVEGKCGINTITGLEMEDLPIKVAAQLKDFNPEEYGVDKSFVRKQDMFSVYAMAAANQAMAQSGLVSGENIEAARLGVYVSSGQGGYSTIHNETVKGFHDGIKWVSPNYIPTMISNMGAAQVAIRHKACGPCVDTVSACASGTNAIGEAYRAIKHGYADAIIAGGSEASLVPMALAGFASARALTKAEDPNYASLPFNANRAGFVFGEGAGVVVLEEYEHAKARGAEILAVICGYGNTCDAYHATAPNPTGETQAASIRMALDEAGYTSDDVLYINAHGTGTALNDKAETVAFKLALGDDAYKAHISSTKSMTGHLLGAAGGVEAVAAVLALMNDIVPPTINLDAPDPDCDLDYTPNKAVQAPLTMAISDSLGFGGHNACLAFRKE